MLASAFSGTGMSLPPSAEMHASVTTACATIVPAGLCVPQRQKTRQARVSQQSFALRPLFKACVAHYFSSVVRLDAAVNEWNGTLTSPRARPRAS